jgi:hypothetical protein
MIVDCVTEYVDVKFLCANRIPKFVEHELIYPWRLYWKWEGSTLISHFSFVNSECSRRSRRPQPPIYSKRCTGIGSHKCDSINCNSWIVIGSDYLVRSVYVLMAGDPMFHPAPKTVASLWKHWTTLDVIVPTNGIGPTYPTYLWLPMSESVNIFTVLFIRTQRAILGKNWKPFPRSPRSAPKRSKHVMCSWRSCLEHVSVFIKCQ